MDFLTELYFKESERRERLDEVPARLIPALALVAAVYTFYLRNFDPDATWLTWLLALSLAATGLLALLALLWIGRASVGYGYAFLPHPTEFESYAESLRQFYAARGLAEEGLASEISESLRQRLIEATTVNSKNNNQRSELFYNAKRFLVGLAASTLVSGIPVLLQLWRKI